MIGRDHHLTDEETEAPGDEVTFSKLSTLLVLFCVVIQNLKDI